MCVRVPRYGHKISDRKLCVGFRNNPSFGCQRISFSIYIFIFPFCSLKTHTHTHSSTSLTPLDAQIWMLPHIMYDKQPAEAAAAALNSQSICRVYFLLLEGYVEICMVCMAMVAMVKCIFSRHWMNSFPLRCSREINARYQILLFCSENSRMKRMWNDSYQYIGCPHFYG